MTDELRKAAEGRDGAFAHATRTAEQRAADKAARRAERDQRRAEEAAATAAQPPADPIAQARELLMRSGDIDTAYSAFHQQRDVALKREQECLRVYRELANRHRNRLNDTRWCATSEGTEVVRTLTALRDEVDRLSGIKPTDVDYQLLWMARIAVYHADYVACVLEAVQPLISAQGNAAPVLVAIDKVQEQALRDQGVREKFFFRVRTPEHQTFYPNDYTRVEVQRVVRELQHLWSRSIESFRHERKRTRELLSTFAPDRADAAGNPLDLVRLLSIAEPSPYGDASVGVALYFGGFKFVPPGEMQPRIHRGVVHITVENGTDSETGGPAKLLMVCEAVGSLERTLPAAGVQWRIVLGKDGDGELGLRKGWNHPDDKPPLAHLRYVQQLLWLAQQRDWTLSQALGLVAYEEYEARRRPKGEGGKKQGTAATGGEAAEAGIAAADKPRRRRGGKGKGGNGVPKDTQAAPAADVVAASESQTGDTPTS